MSNDLIKARLVWDGGEDVHIPPEMGTPRGDQMQGTSAERLTELAGRVCYDSLGKGRPSFSYAKAVPVEKFADGTQHGTIEHVEGYHDHILKVGHGSVLEHFHFTIGIRGFQDDYAALLLINRPGIYFQGGRGDFDFCLTVNLRAIHDWGSFSGTFGPLDDENRIDASNGLLHVLQEFGRRYAPHIIGDPREVSFVEAMAVDPLTDNERWISMFVSGSRGLSHELVRHGDFTAISQRSTRFVDESESDWVEHPLIDEYCDQQDDSTVGGIAERDYIRDEEEGTVKRARRTYSLIVDRLERFLTRRGLDKTSARKQARGAARGYLGNALYTELIFSANVAQWKRMLRQRASVFADAEIRELFCKVLVELNRSRYGDRFSDFELRDSPDGIGQVAVEQRETVTA